ncbi:LamG domain-containing protein [Kitasatospora sp. NBC_01266]|uniref:LamG domain-containing protein n=1 Tax=Kitasatospora sp. NBC_01266 TaxID=2903572 RepID=UPI002E334F31|nr:LamG-like jellyroll fold domain-containing protein [Kitasatospora sp. NBC_01266]
MTDGTEHRGESAAPAQQPPFPSQERGTDTPPVTPAQPDTPSAPGAYGYPQPPTLPQAPAGYGYPQPGNPYAQPQPAQPAPAAPADYQQPTAPFPPTAFAPQPGPPPNPHALAPTGQGPDWVALADRNESQARRKRRLVTIGIVVVACVLGIGAGALVIGGLGKSGGKTKTVATGTASPSASASATAPSNSPTVPGQPNLLADHSGQANVALGPDSQVNQVTGGYAVRFKADSNSFAQSANPVVDVTRSFSISAWVENEATDGPRIAISQGDGVSYSFELGLDATNGQKNWVFRVQTADGGNDSTAVQAVTANSSSVGDWSLLTGTYDADLHSISLYVNGQLAQTTPLPNNGAVWAGPGPLQLGRSREHGQWGSMWAGVIGHILIWDQALSPAQVGDLKSGGTGQSAKPIASWLVG